MAEIILYLTRKDAVSVFEWLNEEKEIAWLVNQSSVGKKYTWQAVHRIESFEPREYCLWRIGTGPLRIPTGDIHTPDIEILDPFASWEQTLEKENAPVPWFGAAAPETFGFNFRENGRRNPEAIGRSGFTWIGNYFSSIGKNAPKECVSWWNRLRRHIKKNATGIPWPGPLGSGKVGSYAFPEAYTKLESGVERDINP